MFYNLIFFAAMYWTCSYHSSYATSYSKFVLLSVDGLILTSTLTKNGNHLNLLVVNLTTVDNENFIFDFHLNVQLFSSNYQERVVDVSGIFYRPFNQSRDLCYYVGKVRGQSESTAALATCDQISGYFMVNNKSYSIEPVSNSKYQLATVQLTPDEQNNFICGINEVLDTSNKLSKRATVLSSLPSMKDRRVRIIELYVASDMLHYQLWGSVDASSARTKSIVNAVNALYNSVDIYVVLVGSEVWTTQAINVSSYIYFTLDKWSAYKGNYLVGNVTSHDEAVLISGMNFNSTAIGLAHIGSMCDTYRSAAVIEDSRKANVAFLAAVMTHEMGHNLGLLHDGASCVCSDSACIMKDKIGSPPTKFSSCSINDLANNWSKGYDLCLWNVPEMSISPNCGNGVVEDGEACDCGGLPSNLCNTTCCNAATCQLTSSYQCASGLCCDLSTCNIYQANTLCRDSDNTCDLPELCDGVSPYCPDNTYKHDGTPCVTDGFRAYCAEGKCRSRDTQCSFVWGSGVKSAPDSCYAQNTFGNIKGNCERTLDSIPKYTPCNVNDTLCGQLFCNAPNGTPKLRYRTVYKTIINGSNCMYAVLNFGTQIPDPAFVPNGAACGSSKMCYNRTCADVLEIQSINPCPASCGSEVCNNKGMCQCLNGLSYPGCTGIVITPPTTITTTTATTTKLIKYNGAHFYKNNFALILVSFLVFFYKYFNVILTIT